MPAISNLHIIFCDSGKSLWNLSNLLYFNRDNLAEYGLRYEYNFSPFFQTGFMTKLSSYLNHNEKGQYSRKIIESVKSFADNGGNEEIRVWLLGSIVKTSLPTLAKTLEDAGLPGCREAKAHMIMGRQENVFLQMRARGWKKVSWNHISDFMKSPDSFYWYDETAAAMKTVFGGDNAGFFPVEESDQRTLAPLLASALNIPGDAFSRAREADFPQSGTALDIFYALWDFPFTARGRMAHDRASFNAMLLRVEESEGLPACADIPENVYSGFAEDFAPHNAALARRMGMTDLFLREKPVLPAPCGNEEASSASCRPFVAAMPEKLRHDALRYFRDMDHGLVPEQIALAKALEEYRVRRNPVSGFSFPRTEPLLTVLTMTRNHNKYILECMESVTAQNVDFPIEHVIVDDCSTDNSQDIIDDYASRHSHVRPLYLSARSGSGENVARLFNVCKSEFAALCDGDDYFTEPSKLQRQVEFLHKNNDCSVCFHPVLALYENNAQQPFIYPQEHLMPRGFHEKYYLADLMGGNFIQTNTVVYRWRFRDGLPAWFVPSLCPGDWYWHLLHAEIGKIGFIPEVMSVYRRHAAAYYANAFQNSSVEHRRAHGMAELNAYKIINEHFNNRYFRSLASLANGVFSDFLHIQLKENDSRLLDLATLKYPEFGRNFLNELKIMQKNYPQTEEGNSGPDKRKGKK